MEIEDILFQRRKDLCDVAAENFLNGMLNKQIARQILKANGITVGGHVLKIGNVCDEKFDPVNVSAEELDALNKQYFSVTFLLFLSIRFLAHVLF